MAQRTETQRPSGPTDSPVPLLRLCGITKDFGSLRANDDISFSINAGEVLGIVGENGAGKSTLVKILGGLLAPGSGKIYIDGVEARLTTPQRSVRAGIGVVHQHFNLIERLTVEQNLVLAQPELRRGILHFEALRPSFQAIADELGVALDFTALVAHLSVAQQQQLELIKALYQRPRILILDEPTAVLAPAERANLMRIISRIKGLGTATILISHKLDDLYASCDRAIVFRHGKLVGEAALEPEQRDALVRMIVGTDLMPAESKQSQPGPPALTTSNLTIMRQNGTMAVDCLSFELRFGEILGLCGVDGNGQSELVQSLAGMIVPSAGTIVYNLKSGVLTGPINAGLLRHFGVAHIPEDRLYHAVVGGFPLSHNWLLRKLYDRAYNRRGWLNRRHAVAGAEEAIASHRVVAQGPGARLAALSGGNQQKFVLARELDQEPKIILAGHPTRGLDLRTIESVRQRLLDARARGAAILLLSADLDELWSIADRIMVLANGKKHGPVEVARTSLQEVGGWMTMS